MEADGGFGGVGSGALLSALLWRWPQLQGITAHNFIGKLLQGAGSHKKSQIFTETAHIWSIPLKWVWM